MYWSERVAAGDEEGEGLPLPPPGAPHLLPTAGDGARVAHQDARLQPPDVDPQLQGVGAHHGADATLPDPPLDGAPLVGKVSPAVALHPPLRPLAAGSRLLHVGEKHLHGQPAAAENDRLDVVGDQKALGDPPGLQQGAPPYAQLAVDDGRVVEDNIASAGGRPAPVHHLHLFLQQPSG